MKIIHCADIHIGAKMTTNLSVEKARERKNELLETFKRMAEYAEENAVDVILISGDLFDEGNVAKSVISEVKEIIESFKDIDFLYVVGNHDNKMERFDIGGFPVNLKLFDQFNEWKSYKYKDINIVGIDILNTTGNSIYNKLILNKDDFNIVVMHGELTTNVNNKAPESIYLNALKAKHIDYLALGHIHNPINHFSTLDERGIYAYSGCLEGRGFDELGEKGFILLEVENKKLKSKEFIPFAERTIYEQKVDITGCDSYRKIEEKVIAETKKIEAKSLIKIILTGRYKAGINKDISRLTKRMNDKFFFTKIVDESSLDFDIKDYENDISVKGEFIRNVFSKDIDKERKDKIIDLGIKTLNGEEIDL